MFALSPQHIMGLDVAKVECFLKLRDGLILGASPGGREHEQGFSIDQKPWCIMGKPGTVKHTTA